MNADLRTSRDALIPVDPTVWVAVATFLMGICLPALLTAEVGVFPQDTGPADTSASDTSGADSVADTQLSDIGTDADPADTATSDVTRSDATTSGDAESDAAMPAPDVSSTDASGDAGDDAGVSGPARLSGQVDVRLADDNALVEVSLTPQFAGWTRNRTTGTSGDFSFDGIPTGQYELTFQRSDYVEVGRTLTIRGDRVLNITLFPDQNVQLRAEAIFQGDSPPSSVEFSLTGERGDLSPDDAISVDGDSAVWTRDDVPVGNWTLSANADRYLDASYELGVRSPESSSSDQYDVRLRLVPEDRQADTVSTDDGGCGCRDEDSRGGGGGRIPGGFGPGALLLVGWLALRRLNH